MSTDPEEYHVAEESAARSEETGTTYDATGEAESTPHDEVLAENAASNPNSASSSGLAGDMGLSSERTGPADETGPGIDSVGSVGSIEGTGTVGTARGHTDGTLDTGASPDGPDASSKTVPESDEEHNPPATGKHPFDPERNPGHSHG